MSPPSTSLLFTLRGHSSQSTALCFIPPPPISPSTPPFSSSRQSLTLLGHLISSSIDGSVCLWSLPTRRVLHSLTFPPTLSIKRLAAPSTSILHQTRDPLGLINIFDSHESFFNEANQPAPFYTFPTMSHTFTQCCPSNSNPNLILAPTSSEYHFGLLDIRVPIPPSFIASSTSDSEVQNGFVFSALAAGPMAIADSDISNVFDKKGMITSLAFASSSFSSSDDDHLVLIGCESGHIIAHDLRFTSPSNDGVWSIKNSQESKPSTSNKKDSVGEPALCVDLIRDYHVGSKSKATSISTSPSPSIVKYQAVAGFAGDATELSQDGSKKGGTVAALTIKLDKGVEIDDSNEALVITSKGLMTTCRIGEGSQGGKPGVNAIEFCAENEEEERAKAKSKKVYAVAGWDHRVRLYSTKGGDVNQVGILKGHECSVGAIDWMPPVNGEARKGAVLASGGEDGRVMIWSCK